MELTEKTVKATGDDNEELKVTFNPPLYLQRQTWILDVLRREGVESVLDIGCGEGSLLQCLTMPSQSKRPSNLPPTSPFVSGPFAEHHTDLYLKEIHGLDPHASTLEFVISATAPPKEGDPPFTGYDRWRTREARWTPLEVNIWEGGFQNINEAFTGDRIDAFVASEVIEHLPPSLLPSFAPVLLGYYQPRLVLLTTPNFTYNQRFSRPGEHSSTGYPDPTGRTNRVFRHADHKFEWTTEEWTEFCTDAASKYGYGVDIGGIGLSVEPDPWGRENILGFASQFAVFRRTESLSSRSDIVFDFMKDSTVRCLLRVRHIHLSHPLTSEELDRSPVIADIHRAVKDAIKYYREGRITFSRAWNYGEVSLACAGDVAALVKAFEQANIDDHEWTISNTEKGWDGIIILKKDVVAEGICEDIVKLQIDSSTSQNTHEPHVGGNGDLEKTVVNAPMIYPVLSDDGSPCQSLSLWEREEGGTWGIPTQRANDVAWGWDVTRTDRHCPASPTSQGTV